MHDRIGTLVPITALRSTRVGPGSGRHGTFAEGEAFIDWLAETGQSLWQMLPLGETHLEPGSSTVRVPSPYRGYGTGIDPAFVPPFGAGDMPTTDELEAFRSAHSAWLPAHALFCAIRDDAGTDDWRTWEPPLRDRDPSALSAWAASHADAIRAHEAAQWRSHRAFARLRAKADAAGILLAGDLPFYLPVQSPLVWMHRGAFEIEPDGSLKRVSGVPDSPTSHFGRQVWGHPLYHWDRLGEVMELWRLRIRHAAGLFGMARIDHSKGFYRHGAIDASGPAHDSYVDGPGSAALGEVLETARAAGLEPIVEDSGMYLHAEPTDLLERMRVPGIRILRFAYNERSGAVSADHADTRRYPRDCVAYTSTHDTLPLVGYLRLLVPLRRLQVAFLSGARFRSDPVAFARELRDALLRSPARRKIVPLQDWLLIPDRINIPGSERPVGDPNWRWRMPLPIEELPKDLGLR